MTHAPCIGGHADGKWHTAEGPRLCMPQMPNYTFADLDGDPSVIPTMSISYYRLCEFRSGEDLHPLWVVDDMSPTEAVRTLINGYRKP